MLSMSILGGLRQLRGAGLVIYLFWLLYVLTTIVGKIKRLTRFGKILRKSKGQILRLIAGKILRLTIVMLLSMSLGLLEL